MRNVVRTIAVVFVLCFSASILFAQTRTSYVIGSYNIRYKNTGDEKAGNGWNERLPVISSLIDFLDFDVFGAQEVLVDQLADLRKALPDYDYVGVGRDDGLEKGEFAPVFYKKARFKKIKDGHFWLSQSPEKPSKGWDAALPRICTYVQLKDKKTGKKFWMFNLHMDHVGTEARHESCKLVLEKIKELTHDEPVLLTGDFNVDQHNEIYGVLQNSKELKDSFTIASKKYAWNGTFNAFDSNLWTDSRIDHIFVSPKISVSNYAVLTETYRSKRENDQNIKKGDFPSELSFKDYQSRLPSDHFPVVVKITF